MKTLLFQVFVVLSIAFQSYAGNEIGLLAELNEASFKMEVYQRQGNMLVVHLENKTATDQIAINIKDNKGYLLHTEKVAGKHMYVKKFDISSLKTSDFEVIVVYRDEAYKADISIKEINALIEIHQRPHKIVAVQTSHTYGEMVTISITNAASGEEIARKQVLSPGKSVNKFDFSKTTVERINVKVVADGKMISEEIKL